MEDKYYTPTKSDICIGMELQRKMISLDLALMKEDTVNEFISNVKNGTTDSKYEEKWIYVNDILDIDDLMKFIEINDISTDSSGNKKYSINFDLYRIKYLDKEDIESLLNSSEIKYEFSNGILKLKINNDVRFDGICKNVSELKRIVESIKY